MTTVVGLINNDETAYREQVCGLAVWCQDNKLSLNVIKTKETFVDYRRTEHTPILIDWAVVEQIESFKLLGVHIKLSWSTHQDSPEEGMTKPISPQETERIWHGSSDPQKVFQLHHREHGCITALYGNCSYCPVSHWGQASCHQDLYTRQCQRKALKMVKDSSHPSDRLFSLLQHIKQYGSAKSRSKRLV